MSMSMLWDVWQIQLVALEGSLQEWQQRHWDCLGPVEATLLAKLALRLYEDGRHALAVGVAFREEGTQPGEEFKELLLRVLRLTAQACGTAIRHGGVPLALEVQEAVGKVYREGFG